MDNRIRNNSLFTQVGFGFSALAYTGAYALCFAAVSGQGLLFSCVCCVACALLSLKTKNTVFAPHPFFAVPLIYVCGTTPPVAMIISVSVAALLYLIVNKSKNKIIFSDLVISACSLGMCVATTILLTNTYFGIGAHGETPLEMLRSYRSLGFHPHFMGLLTGTITLFTTITYPFKFKKLSKIIPTPFICIAIPYVLNLFLNPDKAYTTINETASLSDLTIWDVNTSIEALNYTHADEIITTALVIFIMLIAFSQENKKEENTAMGVCNLFSCFPVVKHTIKGYTVVSAITFIITSILLTLLCPGIFSRIPLHSIGALLIVSGWQSIPYKKLSTAFKQNKVLTLTLSICSIVIFIFTDVFIATFAMVFAFQAIRREAK